MGWLVAYAIISDYHKVAVTCWDLVQTYNYKSYYNNGTMLFYIFAKVGYLFFSLACTNPYIAAGAAVGYLLSKQRKKISGWVVNSLCNATGLSIRSINKFRAKSLEKNFQPV